MFLMTFPHSGLCSHFCFFSSFAHAVLRVGAGLQTVFHLALALGMDGLLFHGVNAPFGGWSGGSCLAQSFWSMDTRDKSSIRSNLHNWTGEKEAI